MNDEKLKNTFTAYLGPDFQLKLVWQLLVDPEFAEKTIPNLAVEYFDDINLKRIFIIITQYFKDYDKVPNLQNKSIEQAISKYKSSTNLMEEDILKSVLDKIKLWNENVINKDKLYDGDVVQKSTNDFIKQQEYRKLAENIIVKIKNGEIKNRNFIHNVEEGFVKIATIGAEENFGSDVKDGIENALRKEFRKTIPTGIVAIDEVTGGGLGEGEIGIILAPTGVGKTTILTKIANQAYEEGKNVLQIIFEDTVDQIKRKHYAIWSKVRLSEMDDNREFVIQKVYDKVEGRTNSLIIVKFSQDGTTLPDIKNWIIRYQKKYGIKFDIVILDYLDKLESHRKSPDRNESELVIVKAFEAMADEFKIPCWSAIQGNRSSIGAEYVGAQQTGGNIKRVQIAHFYMSIAKTDDQKLAGQANIKILKARFAQDGQTWENCIFNNDTMEIKMTSMPSNYVAKSPYKLSAEEQTKKLQTKIDKVGDGFNNSVNNENKEEKPIENEEKSELQSKISEQYPVKDGPKIKDVKPNELKKEEKDIILNKNSIITKETKCKLNDMISDMRNTQGNITK